MCIRDRVNLCDSIPTPLAEAARVRFRAFADGAYVHDTLAFHWARMIEMLHCAEAIQALLNDPDITGTDLVVTGEKRAQGIGVIEAPRGTPVSYTHLDVYKRQTQDVGANAVRRR